jgi:hypothetical protein
MLVPDLPPPPLFPPPTIHAVVPPSSTASHGYKKSMRASGASPFSFFPTSPPLLLPLLLSHSVPLVTVEQAARGAPLSTFSSPRARMKTLPKSHRPLSVARSKEPSARPAPEQPTSVSLLHLLPIPAELSTSSTPAVCCSLTPTPACRCPFPATSPPPPPPQTSHSGEPSSLICLQQVPHPAV